MWRVTSLGLALAASLLMGMACSGDDNAERVCAENGDCQLIGDCCRCVALNTSTMPPACNVTCDATQCFEQHGQVELLPRCVEGLCEVHSNEM